MTRLLTAADPTTVGQAGGAVIEGAGKSYGALAILVCLAIAVALWIERKP